MISHTTPENKPSWEIQMDLKVIVEVVPSSKVSVKSPCYLESKIKDHQNLMTETFPNFSLCPKHHFINHYPHLICCFGPLVSLWTMCLLLLKPKLCQQLREGIQIQASVSLLHCSFAWSLFSWHDYLCRTM